MAFSWDPTGTPVKFTWDPVKARSNVLKHGVTFTEAATVFEDEHAKAKSDEHHHERRVIVGYSTEQRLLVVVPVEILDEDTIRIISARKAEPRERRAHEKSRKGVE